jgi:hypothetical protein
MWHDVIFRFVSFHFLFELRFVGCIIILSLFFLSPETFRATKITAFREDVIIISLQIQLCNQLVLACRTTIMTVVVEFIITTVIMVICNFAHG